MSAILELRNVSKIYGGGRFSKRHDRGRRGRHLLHPGRQPDHDALAGESGSGKTTLSRLLMGVSKPTKGEVLYNGVEFSKLQGDRKQFLLDVQPIYQDPFGVYNPFYKADHLLYVAVKKFDLADSKRRRSD